MKQRATLLLAAITASLLLATSVALAASLLDQQNATDLDESTLSFSTPGMTVWDGLVGGQIFTAGQSGTLDKVSLPLLYEPAPIQGSDQSDLVVQVKAVDGSGLPTGDPLSSVTVPAAEFGTSWPPAPPKWREITFTEPAQVTAGTQYALLASTKNPESCPVSGSGCRNGHYVFLRSSSSNPYSSGYMVTRDYAGEWFKYDGSHGADLHFDAGFKTYVSAAPADSTAPVISGLPSEGVVKEASSPSGALVTFPTITATDTAADGTVYAVNVECASASEPELGSGDTFPLGTTRVECSATDPAGNLGSGSFNVAVRDTTAPAMSNMPQDITEEASGPAGAQVAWQAPTADDVVDGNVNVGCSPASDDIFDLGQTTVGCTATDSHGNSDTKTFSVTVKDTTAPTISGMPSDMNVTATSSSGTTISYTSPTASDLVDAAINVTCQPASGNTFSLGETTVDCSATDSFHNSVTKTFKVNVTYAWSGILQPINGGSTLDDPLDDTSAFKLGSTLPVKFKLTDDSTSVTNAAARIILVKLDGTPNGTELEAGSTNAPATTSPVPSTYTTWARKTSQRGII
jgi:hypothetical protein